MSENQGNDLSQLESILQYSFQNKSLLVQAITHSSYKDSSHGMGFQSPSRRAPNYERLEFFGDAVLGYLIARHLYATFPDMPQSLLTDLKSATANNEYFARVAVRFGLGQFLLRDSGIALDHKIEKCLRNKTGLSVRQMHDWDCNEALPKALGDMVESLAAAIHVDTNFDFEKVWAVFEPLLQPIVTPETFHLDPVRELEQLCNENRWRRRIEYDVVGEPKIAIYRVDIGEQQLESRGEKENKRHAKRLAAKEMLKKLKSLGFVHKYQALMAYLVSNGKLEVSSVNSEEGTSVRGVSEVDRPKDRPTTRASRESSEENDRPALTHGERDGVSAVASAEKFSKVSDHRTKELEAPCNNSKENLKEKLTIIAASRRNSKGPSMQTKKCLSQALPKTPACSPGPPRSSFKAPCIPISAEPEIFPEVFHSGSKCRTQRGCPENALGHFGQEVSAVEQVPNSMASLAASEVCSKESHRQGDISCNTGTNLRSVAPSDYQSHKYVTRYPSFESDKTDLLTSSTAPCRAIEEHSIPALVLPPTRISEDANASELDANSCDFGSDIRGDVRGPTDLSASRDVAPSKDVPTIHSGGQRSEICSDEAEEAVAAGFSSHGRSVTADSQSG